jgi:sortase (surface protein transpeptidase)
MKHSFGAAGDEPAAPQEPRRHGLLRAAGVAWLLMATAAGLLNSPADGGRTAAGPGADDAQSLAELFQDVPGTRPADPDGARAGRDDPATSQEPDTIAEAGRATTAGGAVDAAPVAYVPVRDSSLTQASAISDSPPHPVRLVIPDMGIDMAIGPVGVQADGQMAVPDDVDAVGWYKFGSVPGSSSGTTVLASHVDSWAEGVGPFARLREQARIGTWINVYRSDGSVRSYTVVDNRMIPKTDLPVDLLFNRTGEHRLVLVTCGGRFQRDIGRYTDNIVVTAAPAGF